MHSLAEAYLFHYSFGKKVVNIIVLHIQKLILD